MTLKLEVGKTYKRRDGTLIRITGTTDSIVYPYKDEEGISYTKDGVYWKIEEPDRRDLIEEVKPETPSPVRTVTRKEVVPGVYGRISISLDDDNTTVGIQRTSRSGKLHEKEIVHYFNAKELREAAALMIEIADALENGDETTS